MSKPDFDEAAYLRAYPDVAKAVELGKFNSGLHHYNLMGKREGRTRFYKDRQGANEVSLGNYSLVIRPSLLEARRQAPHTLVIGGSSRGGTSSIAFALYQKNIPMGVEGTVNYEDPVFVDAISRSSFDEAAIEKRIVERNNSSDVWGVKLPDFSFHFSRLEPMLREPVFIMIFRNQVSVARSVLKRTNVFSETPEGAAQALSHAANFYSSFQKSLSNIHSPVICIEYEQLLYRTKPALDEILGLIGLGEADEETIKSLSEPGYKNLRTNAKT